MFDKEISQEELFACSRDVVYFCKYIYINHPTRGVIQFVPRTEQVEMLRSYQDNQRTIVLSGRQRGKTTTSAVFLLWYSIFHSNQTVFIGSPNLSISKTILQIIKNMHMFLPTKLQLALIINNKHECQFEHGTRILSKAITADSVRGYTINLMYIDEAARVDPTRFEQFWTSAAPTIMTGGKCILTSTPSERDVLFHSIWEQSINPTPNETPSFNPIFIDSNSAKITNGLQTYSTYLRDLGRG